LIGTSPSKKHQNECLVRGGFPLFIRCARWNLRRM
jgi:hypothetical protein